MHAQAERAAVDLCWADPQQLNRERVKGPPRRQIHGASRCGAADSCRPAVACGRGLMQGGVQVKAVVVRDQAAGTAGMTLAERPAPQAAVNDVVVEVHASGFTSGEL